MNCTRRWRIHVDNVVSLLHGIALFILEPSRFTKVMKKLSHVLSPAFLDCEESECRDLYHDLYYRIL